MPIPDPSSKVSTNMIESNTLLISCSSSNLSSRVLSLNYIMALIALDESFRYIFISLDARAAILRLQRSLILDNSKSQDLLLSPSRGLSEIKDLNSLSWSLSNFGEMLYTFKEDTKFLELLKRMNFQFSNVLCLTK
jgi:hypothetical protein